MYSFTATYGMGVLIRVRLAGKFCLKIINILTQEPYTWDLTIFYENYPDTVPSDALLAYWACQLAFYCSLLVTHFTSVRRKV